MNHKSTTIRNLQLIDYKDYINNDIIKEVEISGSKLNAMNTNLYNVIISKEETNKISEEAKAYGKTQEPLIREEFEKQHPEYIIYKDLPSFVGDMQFANAIDTLKFKFGASFDGIVADTTTNTYYILEIKAGYRSNKSAFDKAMDYINQITFYDLIWTSLNFKQKQEFLDVYAPTLCKSLWTYKGVMLVSRNNGNCEIDKEIIKHSDIEMFREEDTFMLIKSYLEQKDIILNNIKAHKELVYNIDDTKASQIEALQNEISNVKKQIKELEKINKNNEEVLENIFKEYEQSNYWNNIVLQSSEVKYVLEPAIVNKKDYMKQYIGTNIENTGYKVRKEKIEHVKEIE